MVKKLFKILFYVLIEAISYVNKTLFYIIDQEILLQAKEKYICEKIEEWMESLIIDNNVIKAWLSEYLMKVEKVIIKGSDNKRDFLALNLYWTESIFDMKFRWTQK